MFRYFIIHRHILITFILPCISIFGLFSCGGGGGGEQGSTALALAPESLAQSNVIIDQVCRIQIGDAKGSDTYQATIVFQDTLHIPYTTDNLTYFRSTDVTKNSSIIVKSMTQTKSVSSKNIKQSFSANFLYFANNKWTTTWKIGVGDTLDEIEIKSGTSSLIISPINKGISRTPRDC
ncbi:MAG: hypothetical protein RSE01_06230 [Akkermansia sp.]